MPASSLDQLVSLCKRRGFIFPGSAIYGGLANTWDYGPLGVELKNRVKREWWKAFVFKRQDMVGLDSSILMNPKVWEASGHVGSFSDLMSTCKYCKRLIRMDHWDELMNASPWFHSLQNLYSRKKSVSLEDLGLWGQKEGKKLAPNLAVVRNPSVTLSWLSEFLEKAEQVAPDAPIKSSMRELVKYLASEQLGMTGLRLPCPYCGGELTDPKPFNLLFKTYQGVLEGEGTEIYLRPETAQGIFVNFKNVLDTMRMRLPFGVAQVGKAFRNEITPGNFTFRTREFEQMEIEYFVKPGNEASAFEGWKEEVWNWFIALGVDPSRLRMREHTKEELAFYSSRTMDIEYQFPWGWGELFGLANRGDYDLQQHEIFSGQDLKYTDPDDPTKKFLPYVVEPSFGCDRSVLTFLIEAYTEETLPNGESRTVMKFDKRLAPYDLAILPLSKKEHLIAKAQELYKKIVQETDLVCDFDVTGSIGKRYRRQDEIGTPRAVTVDFGTLGEDEKQGTKDTVTIRDRDSLKQERLPISELLGKLK
ncbi:MAG: glycine--tRNA ligase [Candidatus Peribacteraceae bacterium]|nr:glycine--tRNA ligase [Candidatus Peribacteraceae bacterium]